MKVVINKCYGWFSLSYEGMMKYAELKGIELYAYSHDSRSKCEPFTGGVERAILQVD